MGRYPWAMRAGGPLLGGGEFAPTDLPDLQFWFDASDAATITDAGGGAVSQWDDKSGNGVNVSQGTPANQPNISTFGGFDTILFDTPQVLNALAISVPVGDGTVFGVGTPTSTSGTRVIFNSDAGVTTSVLRSDNAGTNAQSQCLSLPGASSIVILVAEAQDDTTRAVIARHVSGGPSDIENDLGATGTDASVGTLRPAIDNLFVGARTAAGLNSWVGHINELGFYSQALSDPDKTTLMNYLKAKWGL